MQREKAYQILTKYLKNPNLIKHCLACEATMKSLCKRLIPNSSSAEKEKWAMVGLLHDADYELTKDTPQKHGLLIFEKEDPGKFPNEVVYAIQAHNYEETKIPPKSLLDWSIIACDQLTGLIVAAALIHPEKKLVPLTSDFVLKRFQQKAFAKGANRQTIKLCQDKLAIPLVEFVQITLSAMQDISPSLGL